MKKGIKNKRFKVVIGSVLIISILPVIYHFFIGDLGIIGDVITGITVVATAYLGGQSISDAANNYRSNV